MFTRQEKNMQLIVCKITNFKKKNRVVPTVIIDKSRDEVSLLEQDTIENVFWPIKNQKFIFSIF